MIIINNNNCWVFETLTLLEQLFEMRQRDYNYLKYTTREPPHKIA